MHKMTPTQLYAEELDRGEVVDGQYVHPRLQHCSIDTHGIAGYNASPTWSSAQEPLLGQAAADLLVTSILVSRNEIHAVGDHWRGVFMSPSHYFVCRRVDVETREPLSGWWLPLKHVTDSGVLCWPIRLEARDSVSLVVICKPESTPDLIAVHDLRQWQVKSYKVYSPAGLHAAHPGAYRCGLPAVRAVIVDGESDLLRLAASKAFWDFRITRLEKIATDILGLQLPAGATLFGIFFALITHILDLSAKDVVEIISDRLGDVDNVSAATEGIDHLIQLDEAAACLDRNDEADLRKCQQEYRDEAKAQEELVKEWADKKRELGAAGVPAAKAKAKAKRRAASTQVGLPAGSLGQSDLKPFAPAGGFIWRAGKARRWCGHFPPYKRMSVAWSLSGSRGAAIEVLRELWRCYAHAWGLVMPRDCPIPSLYSHSAITLLEANTPRVDDE